MHWDLIQDGVAGCSTGTRFSLIPRVQGSVVTRTEIELHFIGSVEVVWQQAGWHVLVAGRTQKARIDRVPTGVAPKLVNAGSGPP